MVCRENKARSAVIGFEKYLLAKHNGGRREPDHAFQSATHEYGHAYESVKDPTPEEYKEFLLGLRQQIVNDKGLSDADKYRESHKQPGLVTRLDQELKRVETGVDEHGQPLRPEQINGGKHFASMQRMSTLLTRQTQARNAYVDNYARQTGMSVPDAMKRWDSLCARPKEERDNTQISLRDNWQQDLKVAGLTSQHQADLMQSNVARDAVAVMEHERRMKVATLPSRPSVRPEDRTQFITTAEANNVVKCDECGQFGHEGADCPNLAKRQAVEDASNRYLDAKSKVHNLTVESLRARLSDSESQVNGAELLAAQKEERRLEREWRKIGEARAKEKIDDPGSLSREDLEDLYYQEGLAHRDYLEASGQAKHPSAHAQDGSWDYDATVARWEKARAEATPESIARLKQEHEDIRAQIVRAQAARNAARGEQPLVSDAVTEMGFNRDAGVLEVTRPGYTRKGDGVTVAPKRYYYRMNADQYDDMMSSGSVGKFLAGTVGSKEHEAYKFENAADAREATVQRRCPTCGQWATMNSSHQCPTPGSMDSTEEAHYRERTRVARERAAQEGLPARMGENTRRRQILAQSHAFLPGDGVARFPEQNQMVAARERGEVGLGPVTVQYFGETVTAKAYTWKDPISGQAYTRFGSSSCSCGSKETCRHRDHATSVVAAAYRSQRADGASPGGPVMRTADDGTTKTAVAAIDAPDGPIARRSYARIRQDRADAVDQLNKTWAGHPEWRARAAAPTDSATGQPVPVPRTFQQGEGITIDLTKPGTSDVSVGIAMNLSARSERPFQVGPAPSVPGASRITSAPWRRDPNGNMMESDRRELGRLMGLRGLAPQKGILVPDEPSSKYEALSRSKTGQSDIRASRYVAHKGEAYGPEV